MPFFDVQKRLGLHLEDWMTVQSAEQPHEIPGRCHAFEKEMARMCTWDWWYPCGQGVQVTIRWFLTSEEGPIKEERYTPPPPHLGKEAP
ncbi:unnamed protein product [Nyctereutes procyonoides]|uniref:(raccoon dog) hypothetical protein n=1 Tax=Nyctereutes procyonoides TaxID=34880 RepID=A0A811ZEJ2_NYCPR|nr:unnamed protein product [Nyctereutes procyonoides]